jgi:hypothetical protein
MPKSYAMLRADACDDAAGSDDDEAAAAGGNGKAAGKKRTSSKGSGSSTSARQQLTGFEDCEGLFSEQDVYPAYQHGRCQAYHSGKVRAGCSSVGATACLVCARVTQHSDPAVRIAHTQHLPCQVMVLEALLKSIRADEPTDKVVLVSNYTGVGRLGGGAWCVAVLCGA